VPGVGWASSEQVDAGGLGRELQAHLASLRAHQQLQVAHATRKQPPAYHFKQFFRALFSKVL
jgi:hypothetical protein